jgi:hypothetical protein
MAQLAQLSRPVVARAASFHTDEARLKLREERENLAASQCAIESDSPIPCNAMSLKDVLGQIQTDCGNLHGGGSSRLQSSMTTALWRIDAGGAGTIHTGH